MLDSDVVEVYRELITNVYQEHNPAKIEDVDGLLQNNVGGERALYVRICNKYNVAPISPAEAEAASVDAEGAHFFEHGDAQGAQGFADRIDEAPQQPPSSEVAAPAPMLLGSPQRRTSNSGSRAEAPSSGRKRSAAQANLQHSPEQASSALEAQSPARPRVLALRPSAAPSPAPPEAGPMQRILEAGRCRRRSRGADDPVAGRENESRADAANVHILVEGHWFKENAGVLASVSPVFQAFLAPIMVQGDDRSTALPGKLKNEFEEFMKFLRPGTTRSQRVNEENVDFLVRWFHEYEMSTYLQECEDFLLTMEPSFNRLVQAHKYGLREQLARTLSYISQHPLQIPATAVEEHTHVMHLLWPKIQEHLRQGTTTCA